MSGILCFSAWKSKGYRILHTEEKRKNSYRMQVAERIRRKDQKTGSSWGKDHSWDWLPEDWTKIENFYSFDRWWDNDILREGKMKEEYDWVTQNFDKVLAEHGYVREGHYYRAEKANEDTLVFFCHFGVSCVLISYLLSISPLVMLQNFCAAPSSVSTIVTEERRKGIASFRMSSFGDISHLYAHQEPPAFAARFCETYDNKEQRHD